MTVEELPMMEFPGPPCQMPEVQDHASDDIQERAIIGIPATVVHSRQAPNHEYNNLATPEVIIIEIPAVTDQQTEDKDWTEDRANHIIGGSIFVATIAFGGAMQPPGKDTNLYQGAFLFTCCSCFIASLCLIGFVIMMKMDKLRKKIGRKLIKGTISGILVLSLAALLFAVRLSASEAYLSALWDGISYCLVILMVLFVWIGYKCVSN